MNPGKRTLLQVRLEDAVESEEIFSTLMGEDVESRRRFIEDNALDVKNRTCSETRSPVFRPHDASALDSIDVLGLQHTLLIQRAFGRNGNPLIENRASLGVDGGRRVHLHDFPVAGFQRKLRAVDLVNDAANQVLRRGG
jgi:hypothetical protein